MDVQSQAKSSWYSTGASAVKQEEDRQASAYGPSRFWIPANQSREFIFVDDLGFSFYEHNPKINGSWQNWMSCLWKTSDDIACCRILGQKTRYFTGYFTVIDCSKWKDKKGNEHQFEIKFLACKHKTLKKLLKKKEDRGSLVGCLYKATRDEDKGTSVGDEFEFQREVNLDEVFKVTTYKGKKLSEIFARAHERPEDLERLKRNFEIATTAEGTVVPKLVPFNYNALLFPKSSKEIITFLGSAKIDSVEPEGGNEVNEGKADENVPF